MGAADVVPGVSGGTMAFILGIYEELLNSIRILLTPAVLRPLFRFRIKELIEVVPWRFLGSLGAGILLAVFSLSRLLEHLLATWPALVWSFFFGLVLTSAWVVAARVHRWILRTVAGALGGAVGAWLLVGLVPAATPDAPWFLFASGFVAICAMILPGISGSFILVLLGKYQTVLAAVGNRDLATLGIVGAGAAVGLVSFAQVLSWLFRKDHDLTVAILTGFMFGSLRKIWPWKETIRTVVDRHGQAVPVEQINTLPDAWSAEVLGALALAVAGVALVLAIERLAVQAERGTTASG